MVTTAPVQQLESAIADRLNKNQRVPQSWFDRLEELRRGAPPKANNTAPPQQPATTTDDLPFIVEIRAEVKALGDRLQRGKAWLHQHSADVRPRTAEETCGVCAGQNCTRHGWLLGAVKPEDRWHALTAAGGRVLALFCALSLLHRIDMRLLAGDALLREEEARHGLVRDGSDEEAARIVDEMGTLQDLREEAVERVATAERGMGNGAEKGEGENGNA